MRRLQIILLLVCLTACGRRDAQQALPQIAILSFENLSPDASLNWMGAGFAAILSAELQGSPQLYAIPWRTLHAFDAALGPRPHAPGVSTENAEALVAGANQIVSGYFSIVNGVLRAAADQEDLLTHQVVRTVTASGPASGGIFPVAAALARQLGETHPYGTRSEPALHDLLAARESPDPAAAAQGFAQATQADPDFGPPYVYWLELAIAARNRAVADQIIAQARAHAAHFSGIDRAELDLAAAALHADFPAQLEALRTLTRLDPANPDHHRALASALMSTRNYDDALVEFRRALTIRPDDPAALNAMGYAAAFSGDLPTAIRVLRGYEHLRPSDPNPLDSLGDAHFALGHFAEAGQFYLAAHAKSAAFLNGGELLKAAQARLMTGDVPGATALFNHYRAERDAAHDPNVPYQAAVWSWQTGTRQAAIAAMDRLARSADAGQQRADAQLAFWLLESGDRPAAIEHARKSVSEAAGAFAPLAALVANLVEPEVFPAPAQSPFKEYARTYTLLLNRQFKPAAEALQDLYGRPTNDLDDGLAVLLAWAYEESGDFGRAEPLLRLTPLPEAAGPSIFASFYFPRLFALRAAVLDRHGQHAEAARYNQLFHKLSPEPRP